MNEDEAMALALEGRRAVRARRQRPGARELRVVLDTDVFVSPAACVALLDADWADPPVS
jgi:hypothetical protein